MGTTVTDATGNYAVDLIPALTNGEVVNITATDAAGNESTATQVTADDTTAPAVPVVGPINETDPITGTAEPGSTVTATYPDGTQGTVVVGSDGTWVLSNPNLKDGDEVKVIATDPAGNSSLPTVVIVDTGLNSNDTTAPSAPIAEIVNDGTQVIGTAEAGSTVTVKGSDGKVLGTTVTDATGNYAVDLIPALTNGEVVNITATDAAGNESTATQVTADDTTAPAVPVVGPINETDPITGTAEPGSTVTATYPDGTQGTVVVGSDGTWVLSNPNLKDGDEVKVIATDPAGNSSLPTVVIVDTGLNSNDTTAPSAPIAEIVNDGTQVIGTAEAGSTVTVKGSDGKVLGTTVTDATGNYAVDLIPALTNGEVVNITATDAAGNESTATQVTADDTTAPAVPVVGPINETDPITGTAEPGSTVTATYPDGTQGTVVVGSDGTWVLSNPNLKDGDEVKVIATDPAGNSSLPTVVIVDTGLNSNDTTAPSAPIAEIVNDGTQVIGTAEAGSTVTVKGSDGKVLGTTVTDATGNYAVDLIPALTNGEVVNITATDAAGNESTATQVTADDTTAPAVPVVGPINETDPITGTAEPGSTVTATYPDGTQGTVVVGSDGTWVLSNPNLKDGDEVKVIATDPAGNSSLPTVVIVDTGLNSNDTTAPSAPIAEIVNDGTQVIGTAEAGSTVTVKGSDGKVLGTTVTDATGNYAVDLIPALTNGEVVNITATDAAGNESTATQVTADDTTAPAVPVVGPINETDPITGTAEPGSTVTATYPDGTQGTVVVGSDGTWVLSNPNLKDGDEVKVIATDPAGNSSLPTVVIVDTGLNSNDTTAPSAPIAEIVNDGTQVIGTAEAGSTVTVKGSDGKVLGTTVTDATGNYAVDLIPALTNGEVVNITATDAAGNESTATQVTADDTTAPAVPVVGPINETDPITGTAEPGSTVTATYPDGTQGTVVVGSDGTWVLSNPNLKDGDEVKVIATDPAGNSSLPTVVIVDTGLNSNDTTAPSAPIAEIVNDGTQVIGTAEAGSTVTVKGSDGKVLGTTVTDATGNYAVDLIPALTNGEVVNITATDAAGNRR